MPPVLEDQPRKLVRRIVLAALEPGDRRLEFGREFAESLHRGLRAPDSIRLMYA